MAVKFSQPNLLQEPASLSYSPRVKQNAIRGAKIGALSTGCAAFLTGTMLCIVHRLPIPPLAITEFGILFGGLLGAGAGILCSEPRGRLSLLGIVGGLLAGAVIALPLEGPGDPLGVLRIALLGSLIGWRLALNAARARLNTPAWTPMS
jgi:hypothetical protein